MNSTKEKVAKVRDLVGKSNLTAYRIAQSVNSSVTTISAILNGTNTNPRDETLNEILIFLAKPDKSPTPQNVHFDDLQRLILDNVVPKLDAIIEFIAFVYPEHISKIVDKEKESLTDAEKDA